MSKTFSLTLAFTCTSSSSYSNFLRQLSHYGYIQLKNQNQGAYHHPFLVQGKPELCQLIKRKHRCGTQEQKTSHRSLAFSTVTWAHRPVLSSEAGAQIRLYGKNEVGPTTAEDPLIDLDPLDVELMVPDQTTMASAYLRLETRIAQEDQETRDLYCSILRSLLLDD